MQNPGGLGHVTEFRSPDVSTPADSQDPKFTNVTRRFAAQAASS